MEPRTVSEFAALAHNHAEIVIALGAVLGLIVGSFLNVVILRLPVMMENAWRRECQEIAGLEPAAGHPAEPFNLIVPPSRCPGCGHRIRPWENVPVLSYVALRGRCAKCRNPISPRYPLIECVTAILSAAVILRTGLSTETLALLAFTWCLIALTVIDIDHQLLPDDITLPLLWLGLLLNSSGTFVPLHDAVWGAVAGYLSLWSVYWGFKLVTGKEGMGYGDFKLLGAIGAWLGWQTIPLVIILSSLAGAVIGLGLILLRGRDRNIPIPFGPYLAIAAWVTALWSDDLLPAYASTFTSF